MARLSQVVAGCLALALSLPMIAAEPTTGAEVVNAANAQAADGDEAAAIATLQAWLANHPDDELVKNRSLTLAARRDARNRMAETKVEIARADSPVAQAEALVGAGNHKEAVELLEKWLADHPDDKAAKGKLLQVQIAGKEAEIRSLLKQQANSTELMMEDPDYVAARRLSKADVKKRLEKAEYLVSQRRYSEAGELCNGILADYPEEPATSLLKYRLLDTMARKERESLARERDGQHDVAINDTIKNAIYPAEKPKVTRQVMIFDEDISDIERAQVAVRLQEKIDLNHNQAKVWDVMQALFAVAGINYVVLDSALGDETISLHIVNDSVESALNAISKLTKIRFAYHAGTVFVSSDANEGLVSEIIRLKSGLTDVSATVTSSSFDSGGTTSNGNNNGNGGQNGSSNQPFGGNGTNTPSTNAAAAAASATGGAGGGSDLEKFLAKIPEQVVGWPSEGKIYLDRKSNSLYVKATPWAISELKRLLHGLDYNNVQVLIEARFIQVTEEASQALGIAWQQGQVGSTAQAAFGSPTAPAISPATKINTNGNGAMITGFLQKGDLSLTATLKALQKEGKSDTLAEPKILTLNNQNGLIEIAENYPYIENYTITSNSSSGYNQNNNNNNINNPYVTISSNVATPVWSSQDIGYQLKIQPSVARNSDIITLKLQPKIKQVSLDNVIANGFEYLPSSNATSTIKKDIQKPRFSTRTLETTLHVANGKTVALGGLVKELDSKSSEGTPFLKSIPILGRLFSSDNSKNERSNLIILVTATIVDPTGAKVGDDILRLRDTARVLLPGTPRGEGMPATKEEADALPPAGTNPPTTATPPADNTSPGAPGKQRGHR